MKTVEITEGVHWVGVKDWNRKVFDALISLPRGTSYNSYLIVGDEKTALIDTVYKDFEGNLEEKVNEILDLGDIDYIIMNHAEPDHSGAIPYILKQNTKVSVVTTKKGAEIAKAYYDLPDERLIIVREGDEISLGGKTLRFIEAPWLHWPETMFTYLLEDKILFTCDFFGAHIADGLYDDEVPDIMIHAQRYFGEIMMPFSSMVRKALQKIEGLDVDMIAPSHGPIYRNPQRIIDAHKKWSRGETQEKVLIVYVSMYGTNEEIARKLADRLIAAGIEVEVYDLVSSDIGDIAKDLVDSRAIVLAAPTVLAGAHPLAVYTAYLVKALRPPAKYTLLIGSHGWYGKSNDVLLEMLKGLNFELIGTLDIHARPSAGDYNEFLRLTDLLIKKVKEG